MGLLLENLLVVLEKDASSLRLKEALAWLAGLEEILLNYEESVKYKPLTISSCLVFEPKNKYIIWKMDTRGEETFNNVKLLMFCKFSLVWCNATNIYLSLNIYVIFNLLRVANKTILLIFKF